MHSRHLEVLKENMSLLSNELGPEIPASEILGLSIAAKNELHAVQGYSPNQRCFGQAKNRIQSYLEHGENLPTQSHRENASFEAELERATQARQTFLKADSRRRILRAARGKARRTEAFLEGQLVYYYRRGRNASAKYEAGWHGPARVVAIEKQGDGEQSQTQGSVIWVVHATVLYRCAPEQLRHVTTQARETFETLHGTTSPLLDVRRAGNQANYRDITDSVSPEPEDSELHDVEPSTSRLNSEFPATRLWKEARASWPRGLLSRTSWCRP